MRADGDDTTSAPTTSKPRLRATPPENKRLLQRALVQSEVPLLVLLEARWPPFCSRRAKCHYAGMTSRAIGQCAPGAYSGILAAAACRASTAAGRYVDRQPPFDSHRIFTYAYRDDDTIYCLMRHYFIILSYFHLRTRHFTGLYTYVTIW